MKKQAIAMVLCLAMALGNVFNISAEENPKRSFWDIRPTDWYYPAITAMANQGYIAGYEDGSVKPNNLMTIAEYVVTLTKIKGLPGGSSPTHWAGAALDDAIIAGWYHNGDFMRGDYDRPVSRQLAAKLIVNALELPQESYTGDIKDKANIHQQYINYVLAAYKGGIFKGDENGNFNPTAALTRAEACFIFAAATKTELIYPEQTESLYDTFKNNPTLGLVEMYRYFNGRVYPTPLEKTGNPIKDGYSTYLVPKNGMLTGIEVEKGGGVGHDITISLQEAPKTMFDGKGNFADGNGKTITAEQSYDKNGVFQGVSGYTLQSRRYVKELLKIAYPTRYEMAYELLHDTLLDKVFDREISGGNANSLRTMDNKLFATFTSFQTAPRTVIHIGFTGNQEIYEDYPQSEWNFSCFIKRHESTIRSMLREYQMGIR